MTPASILLSLCTEVEDRVPHFEHSAVFGMHTSSEQEAALIESCAFTVAVHVIFAYCD